MTSKNAAQRPLRACTRPWKANIESASSMTSKKSASTDTDWEAIVRFPSTDDAQAEGVTLNCQVSPESAAHEVDEMKHTGIKNAITHQQLALIETLLLFGVSSLSTYCIILIRSEGLSIISLSLPSFMGNLIHSCHSPFQTRLSP